MCKPLCIVSIIVTRLGAVRIAALSGAAAHVPVLCDPCACVRPFVPCVPRLPTVTFYRFLVEVQKGMSSVPVEVVPATTNTVPEPGTRRCSTVTRRR